VRELEAAAARHRGVGPAASSVVVSPSAGRRWARGVEQASFFFLLDAASLLTRADMTQHDLAQSAEVRREIALARWIRAGLLLGVAVALAWPA
jgi:hypothetical protein